MPTRNHYQYPYKKVFDYYIIQAWRGLKQPLPAYTPEMVRAHTALIMAQPFAGPTPSGDRNGVIGMTAGWPKNPEHPDDPEIPRQEILAYKLTDPKVAGVKSKVILSCGQHATEFTGNWVIEGMVNFLAGEELESVFLRQAAEFYVYPDMNPDGRYQAVRQIDMKAAPDPHSGTNMRMRGNPEIYAAGEQDHNRLWDTNGRFSTIDALKRAWTRDTGGKADYFWDIHGPQEHGNWRTPSDEARTGKYAEALMRREPDAIRCGPESGFKPGVANGPPGKLMLYAVSGDGLLVANPYVYEPGGWSMEKLLDSGRRLMLALYDVLK